MQEEKEEKKEAKSENKALNELKKNPWIGATFVFAIITLILLFVAFRGGGASESSVGESAVNFINTQLLQGQGMVVLESVNEKEGIYEVNVNFQNRTIPTYFTKDGEYYLGTMIVPVTGEAVDNSEIETETQTPQEIVKSDKPEVELFVMTHCPYGTQAEKGVLPAVKALGNSVDFKIRFVHYFMHGDKEEQESYRQLCIRETMPAKFNDYLNCFLEDGDSSRCLSKYGINVDSCMNSKGKEYYASDSELSNGYGVQGSPTLVINGVQADFYPRSPDNALKVICSAFNNEPSACSQSLSTANPDPGFGTTSSGSGDAAAAASC